MKANVIIIGGGIVGSSVAYHLARTGQAGDICVIERDPSYEFAATPRSNGGIRRLFSRRQNIEMAQYGLDFYARFSTDMEVADGPVDIAFRHFGYLFLSDAGGARQMERNFVQQRDMGVDVQALTAAEVSERYPSVSGDGIELAVLSAHDAWIDPHAALMGFKAKARSLGVRYLTGEVTALKRDGPAVRVANLADGRSATADVFVNATGAWCASLVATIGLELPVQPMSRESFFWRSAQPIEPLPFIKTETDLAFRPDAGGFVGGVPDWQATPGWNFDISQEYFESVVWPALAARIPAMESIRLERSWRGHYARSMFDLSPIIGPASGYAENLILANGFSGHGIMHAPAAGRGIAEWVTQGHYSSIDLECFSFERIAADRPFLEQGII